MSLERLPNEEYVAWKYRLLVGMANGELDAKWEDVNNILGLGMHKDTVRKGSIFLPEFNEYVSNKKDNSPSNITYNYKETTEILGDGSHKSDKVIEMSPDQSKDADFLLKSHGFDVDEWEITSAKNSIWNANTKSDGIKTLYSSKISVKPKVNGFNVDKMVERMQKEVKPVHVKQPFIIESGRLLEIPFVDMHFGINNYEMYQSTLVETLDLIRSKKWDTIYIPIGNDLLHNNDFKGRTANGTIIDKVDMMTAWNDAFNFYSHIYEEALKNSVLGLLHKYENRN